MADLECFVRVPEDVLSQKVGGELVLLHLSTGRYYTLDETGSRMWMLLAELQCPSLVVDTLVTEYEVTRGRAAADLLGLLAGLESHGLVETRPRAAR